MAAYYWEYPLLILLLAFLAFHSAAEVSFLSISSVKTQSLLEKNAPGAQTLARLRQNRRKVIIALLIAGTLISIAVSAIATSIAIDAFGEPGVGIAVGVMTFIILTFAEIAPKSAATTYGEKMALAFAAPLELLTFILSPLVLFFDFINHLIPGVYSKATRIEHFTEDEVRSAVRLGAKHKSITERERELIENVLELNDRRISQVMVSRAGVVTLNADSLVKDAHKKAVEYGYARFPVLGKKGEVLGVASMRTLGVAMHKDPLGWVAEHMRPVVNIPQDKTVSEAFHDLQKLGRNMGIVVDAHGKFVGIVTMEDLLAEIVGDFEGGPRH
jgi:putative hemolysin